MKLSRVARRSAAAVWRRSAGVSSMPGTAEGVSLPPFDNDYDGWFYSDDVQKALVSGPDALDRLAVLQLSLQFIMWRHERLRLEATLFSAIAHLEGFGDMDAVAKAQKCGEGRENRGTNDVEATAISEPSSAPPAAEPLLPTDALLPSGDVRVPAERLRASGLPFVTLPIAASHTKIPLEEEGMERRAPDIVVADSVVVPAPAPLDCTATSAETKLTFPNDYSEAAARSELPALSGIPNVTSLMASSASVPMNPKRGMRLGDRWLLRWLAAGRPVSDAFWRRCLSDTADNPSAGDAAALNRFRRLICAEPGLRLEYARTKASVRAALRSQAPHVLQPNVTTSSPNFASQFASTADASTRLEVWLAWAGDWPHHATNRRTLDILKSITVSDTTLMERVDARLFELGHPTMFSDCHSRDVLQQTESAGVSEHRQLGKCSTTIHSCGEGPRQSKFSQFKLRMQRS